MQIGAHGRIWYTVSQMKKSALINAHHKYTLWLAALIVVPRFIGLRRIALPAETAAVASLLQRPQSAITPTELLPFRGIEIALAAVLLLMLYNRLRPIHPVWAVIATLLVAWEPIFAAYSRLWLPEPLAALALLLMTVTLPDALRGEERMLWLAGILGGVVLAANASLAPVVLLVSLTVLLMSPNLTVAERWLFWLAVSVVAGWAFSPAVWRHPTEFLSAAVNISFSPPTAAPLLSVLAVLSPVGLLGIPGFIFRYRKWGGNTSWLPLAAIIVFGGLWLTVQPDVSPVGALAILLPIILLAARGWWLWLQPLSSRRKNIALAILAAGQLASIGWSAPYLVTFTNPLWGNLPLSARWVEIPDGVGVDAAAAWLNARPDALDGVVGTDTPQLLSPFYAGQLTAFTSPDAGYVVLTRAQQRAEKPSPTILRYYDVLMEPEFSAVVRGQVMARVYRAPVVRQAIDLPRGLDTGILPKPLAFRLDSVAIRRGESLTVDVIWLAPPNLPPTQSVLSVRSLIRFEADMVEAEDIPPPNAEIFAETTAPLQAVAAGLVVSRHRLNLPADIPIGQYSLVADGRPIGVVAITP